MYSEAIREMFRSARRRADMERIGWQVFEFPPGTTDRLIAEDALGKEMAGLLVSLRAEPCARGSFDGPGYLVTVPPERVAAVEALRSDGPSGRRRGSDAT